MEDNKEETNAETKVEENAKPKNNKKLKKILIICIIILFVGFCVCLGYSIYLNNYKDNCCNENLYDGNYQKVSYIASEEFRQLKKGSMLDDSFNKYKIVSNYDEYKEILSYVKKMSYIVEGNNIKYNSGFFENNSLLAVECSSYGSPNMYSEISKFKIEDSIVNVIIKYDIFGVTADCVGDIYFMVIPKNVNSANIEYTAIEYFSRPMLINGNPVAAKPIIYIYPEEETDVSVKLVNEENILHTYPKYKDLWEVTAKPNGDLIDKQTGRNLYALYWEGKNYNAKQTNEGFVVKGQDTISFLEEKLEVLGLNEREANEFIIYWLPQMENNKYNYIRFENIEEINEYMPLEINPKPDNVIRVLMIFKPLEEEIDVIEQKLETPSRQGYTVVEWGGSKIN